jgi:hypothetical protein
VPHIAAKLAAEIIADEQVDGAILGLRLERQLALRLLEEGAEQSGEHQGFGEQPLDHRRIGVAAEDRVEHRAEPSDPAARVARGDRDAKCDVARQFDCRHER